MSGASGFALGLGCDCCAPPCEESYLDIIVTGCAEWVEGATVTLSHAASSYTETHETDADGLATFAPPTDGVDYDYTVTPPEGSGYATKTGTIHHDGCEQTESIVLVPDADHVCVPCCAGPIPRVLHAGTLLGDLELTYGTMPPGPPLPLGAPYHYPLDGKGWYGEVTGFVADALPFDSPKVLCPDGFPYYTTYDCNENASIADATGADVTQKYWFFCSWEGTWVAIKVGYWMPGWFPAGYGPTCYVEGRLSDLGHEINEFATATDSDACRPFSLSFPFTRIGVTYTYGCGLNYFDRTVTLPGWAETVSLTP